MVLTVLLIALIVCVPKERLQVAEPIDGDQDGFVNLDDVTGYTAKLFRRMDSRGTGRLTGEKYCGEIPPANTIELDRCHTRFARIDAKGDAYIALDEVQDFYRLVLRTADRNSDGKVSLDEWLAAKAKE